MERDPLTDTDLQEIQDRNIRAASKMLSSNARSDAQAYATLALAAATARLANKATA
jgi:hypothetical protein